VLQLRYGVKSVETVLFFGCWRAGFVGGVVSVIYLNTPDVLLFPALS